VPRPASLAAALALVAGGGALAAGSAAQTATAPAALEVDDPAEGTAGVPDLVRLGLARAADGRLRAALTLAAPLDGGALVARGGPPGSLCVKLWTTAAPPDEAADHLVCVTATRSGRLRGSVLRDRPNRLPERVATVAVTRPSSRSLAVRFSQASVGRPARLRVQAETSAPGCRELACTDVAPDGRATATLVLRRAGG
jgi:hypothetical protein